MTQHHPHPDGASYPADHVVAVLQTREQAERAASALRDAGFAADDITLFHGEKDLDKIKHHESLMTRLSRLVEPVAADAGRRLYLDALAHGRSVLLVYAPDQEAVEQACKILDQLGVHQKQAFRRWYVEDLPEQPVIDHPAATF